MLVRLPNLASKRVDGQGWLEKGWMEPVDGVDEKNYISKINYVTRLSDNCDRASIHLAEAPARACCY